MYTIYVILSRAYVANDEKSGKFFSYPHINITQGLAQKFKITAFLHRRRLHAESVYSHCFENAISATV